MTTAATTSAPRTRGRPREFDMDDALDKAILVFSERGYHATSVGDLTAAMGLASGSVYKAFKDKQAVFIAAFDRYKAIRDEKLRLSIARGANGKDKLRRMIEVYATASHGTEGMRGCLVISTAAELATFDPEIAERFTRSLARSEALLGQLLREGMDDGSIPGTVDPDTTARLLLCVLQGMRVIGKTGRARRDMQAVADQAMSLVG